MDVTRRDFLTLLTVAGALGAGSPRALAAALEPERLLDFEPLGNVTLLHMTDPHGTLLPVYYREPDTLIGAGAEAGTRPFLTGDAFLRAYGIARGSAAAYALTHLDFAALAARHGRMGGYSHIATLVKRVRAARPGQTLLLDGGDTLQGSATALWTRGEDMVRAMNLLGVEVFTPHWEFTHGIDRVKELFGDRESRGLFRGDFVCHNCKELNWDEPVFHPYTIRELGGVKVGVIGQAFPYVPISHPQRLVPNLTFGIQEEQAQRLVTELRDDRKVDVVVLLSHNGLSTDVKMAGRVRGIDVVLGGHTHDGLPEPIPCHTIDLGEAKKRADKLIEDLSQKQKLDGSWNGMRYEFTATGVKRGSIALAEGRINVDIELTFLAAALKGAIEDRLQSALKKNFPQGGGR